MKEVVEANVSPEGGCYAHEDLEACLARVELQQSRLAEEEQAEGEDVEDELEEEEEGEGAAEETGGELAEAAAPAARVSMGGVLLEVTGVSFSGEVTIRYSERVVPRPVVSMLPEDIVRAERCSSSTDAAC